MRSDREHSNTQDITARSSELLRQLAIDKLGSISVKNCLCYPLVLGALIGIATVGATATPKAEAQQPRVKLVQPKILGIAEDRTRSKNLDASLEEMGRIAETNADIVRMTAVWVTGQIRPSDDDLGALKNGLEAAKDYGMEVMLSSYPCSFKDCPKNTTPNNTWEQGKFLNWLASLAYELPTIKYFVVGNEDNSVDFWKPQFRADGADAAAASYYKLLAKSYDVLKKAAQQRGNEIIVIGGATSSTGTQPPLTFIENLGKAYRASGRTRPIMDIFAHHPYPDNSSQPPSFVHSGDSIGIADYDRLIGALGKAFDGTAQQGSKLPILYNEFGIETVIPANKKSLYKGFELPNTQAVEEAVQAAYNTEALGLVACQPNVIGITFFLSNDEPRLDRWQSGLRYYDGSPKTSLAPFKKAAQSFRSGSMKC